MTTLAERDFTREQAGHSIASGSLLVRTDDDAFTLHPPVGHGMAGRGGGRAGESGSRSLPSGGCRG